MKSLTEPVLAEPRKEGDPDVVAEITSLLTKANHPQPEAWLQSKCAQEAKDPTANPLLQRFLINRHFRLALGRCEKSTTTERFALIDDEELPTPEYLSVFGKYVVPTLVREALY